MAIKSLKIDQADNENEEGSGSDSDSETDKVTDFVPEEEDKDSKKKERCFICKAFNHFAKNCPRPASLQKSIDYLHQER